MHVINETLSYFLCRNLSKQCLNPFIIPKVKRDRRIRTKKKNVGFSPSNIQTIGSENYNWNIYLVYDRKCIYKFPLNSQHGWLKYN